MVVLKGQGLRIPSILNLDNVELGEVSVQFFSELKC